MVAGVEGAEWTRGMPLGSPSVARRYSVAWTPRWRRAAVRAGDATLVAVSKTVGVDEVVAAIDAGYRVFGENRPQELTRKLEGLSLRPDAPPVRFDMIGNLQTNKINAVLGRVELVHSIGSLHLARALAARAERRLGQASSEAPQSILIEVNVSGEGDQGRFCPQRAARLLW